MIEGDGMYPSPDTMVSIVDTWQTIGSKPYFTSEIKLDMGAVEGSSRDHFKQHYNG
jgi:hypothetical protein